MKKSTLVAIDGKSIFYRGYYGLPGLRLKDGTPTGGVYGFASMILDSIKRFNPDYVVIAWDKSKTNIRRRLELYPQYKANRSPMPEEMRQQIPLVKELADAFSWPFFELDDYEADDILGAVAEKAFAQNGTHSILVTSDQDVYQLINDYTVVASPKKGITNMHIYDLETFVDEYGINPEQLIDLKALMGDSSDNIPGVKGVGRKTALNLIEKYNNLENIYQNINDISGSVGEKLRNDREMAFLSKKLVTLDTKVPIKLDLSEANINMVDGAAVSDILDKLEFRSLRKLIPESWKDIRQNELEIESDQSPKSDLLEINANSYVESDSVIVVPFIDKIIVSKESKSYSILSKEEFNDLVKSNPKIQLITSQYRDFYSLTDYNLNTNIVHDLYQVQYLINPADASIFSEILKDTANKSPSELVDYCWKIYQKQQGEVSNLPKIKNLISKIEIPIMKVLAKMEKIGIGFDKSYIKDFSEELSYMISDEEQEIYGLCDKQFNINSPIQLAEVLYSDLDLPTQYIKKTKSGFSTSHSELLKIEQLHPVIAHIISYRELAKLKNTYVDTLPDQVKDDGRIHGKFDLDVAATGRLSSRDPNLQNIPVKTDLGRRIRTAFVARPGFVFLNADYSQFELRIVAALAKERHMIDAFNKDIDIHSQTAAEIFGVSLNEVTKQQRYSAKAVNFGVLYGQGPHGLSQATKMNMAEAKKFIDRYFEIMPNIKKYIEELKAMANNLGYVETLFGRRKLTPDVHSSNFIAREAAYRAAVNMPIQGTAADLTKLAMIRVNDTLPKDASIILQVHDSIMIECREADGDFIGASIKKIMESICPELGVKLTVDLAVGKNWGDI
jgi:DNA polymerase-1